MKKIFPIILILFSLNNIVFAQGIGIGTQTPHASAALEIEASDKGLLMPRLTTTQRLAVESPAPGLMVFDVDANSFFFNDGSNWIEISNTSGKPNMIGDADCNTLVEVEKNTNEDKIRFSMKGTEFVVMDSGRIDILNTGGSVFIGQDAGLNDDFSSNSNVFIGFRAGEKNTDGERNIFIGSDAGLNNTTGSNNTFAGANSGLNNSTGHSNSFFGDETGVHNSTGSRNNFFGRFAGNKTTIGVDNVFLGYSAGDKNTEGENNTFVGNYSGYQNTTGVENTYIGIHSGYNSTTGERNTFTGTNSGYKTTSGLYNVAIGTDALYENQTGRSNIAIGFRAAQHNTADESVAVGDHALADNTTGERNTAVGFKTLTDNVTGAKNTALGYLSLTASKEDENTSIGALAMAYLETGNYNTGLGTHAMHNSIDGYGNVCLGYDTDFYNEHGNHNTIIGYRAGRGASQHTKSRNVFIGYEAGYYELGNHKLYIESSDTSAPLLYGEFDNDLLRINGSLEVRDNNLSVKQPDHISGLNLESWNDNNDWTIATDIDDDFSFFYNGTGKSYISNSDGNLYTYSDRRLKGDISYLGSTLSKVLDLAPATYYYHADKERRTQLGFIAQEVEALFPAIVNEKEGNKSLNYAAFGVLAIQAIKEQQQTIQNLEEGHKDLQEQIAQQGQQLDALQKIVADLQAQSTSSSNAKTQD